MSLPTDEAWCPAKTYGYGWGLPARWQGWLVMGAFFVALAAGAPAAEKHPLFFATYSAALAAVLIVLCYWKGESPRWRWGDSTMRKKPNQTPKPTAPSGRGSA